MGGPTQPWWVYFLLDRTGVMADRIHLLEEQLNTRLASLEQGGAGSRVVTTVIAMGAPTCQIVPRQESGGFQVANMHPGCDLGEALRLLEDSLRRASVGLGEKVKVFVLLNSEPAGDWERRVRALQAQEAQVFAFGPKDQVQAKTLKRIAPGPNQALVLEAFNRETVERVFDHIFEILSTISAAEVVPGASNQQPRVPSPQARAQAPRHDKPLSPSGPHGLDVGTPPDPPRQTPGGEESAGGVSQPEGSEAPLNGIEPVALADQQEDAIQESDQEGTLRPEVPQVDESETEIGQDKRKAKPVPIKIVTKESAAHQEPRDETLHESDAESFPDDKDTGEGTEVTEPEVVASPPPVDREGVATIWRELEPDPELGDRVDHTLTDTCDGLGGWRMIGASLRGKMHAHKGIFREDAFALGEAEGWHLMVVADGGGSCSLSRVGSKLAADTAVRSMAGFVKKMSDGPPAKMVCRLALERSLEEAWEALSEEAEKRKIDLRELGTTFLALMYRSAQEGHIVGVAQVGDGLVAAKRGDGNIVLLGEPDVGETAGVTFFLTSKHWKKWIDRISVEVLEEPPQLLTAMCDGVADDFIPFEKHLSKLFVGLKRVIEQKQPETALLELLGYEKRGSFDDRTLTLLYQAGAESTRQAEGESDAEGEAQAQAGTEGVEAEKGATSLSSAVATAADESPTPAISNGAAAATQLPSEAGSAVHDEQSKEDDTLGSTGPDTMAADRDDDSA